MITTATWSICIDTLGVPAKFDQVKAPKVSINLPKIGLNTVSKEDSQLIQAIGFGGKILTIKAIDMSGTTPVKFDTLTVGAKLMVIDSVQEVLEPGTGVLMGWRCFVKGT